MGEVSLEMQLAEKDVFTFLNSVYFALLEVETGAQLNVHSKNTYLHKLCYDQLIVSKFMKKRKIDKMTFNDYVQLNQAKYDLILELIYDIFGVVDLQIPYLTK